MIKDYLDNETTKILSDLVSIGGAPEHPAFLSWSSGVYEIEEVSPFSEVELVNLSTDELVSRLREWQPDPVSRFGPEEISYEGPRECCSQSSLDNLDKYASILSEIASLRPEFASSIIGRWANAEESSIIPWQTVLTLARHY